MEIPVSLLSLDYQKAPWQDALDHLDNQSLAPFHDPLRTSQDYF